MKNFSLAALTRSFEESATLALSAKAKKLASEGKSIINFGVGEPDFVTDEAVIEAGCRAARSGETKYTAVGGKPTLRKAIAGRLSQDYGVEFAAEEIVVSAGGKQAIYHFLQSVVEPGDEVIIPSPYWVSFPEMVKVVGGKPVIVRPTPLGDSRARLTAEDLRSAITPRTKVLILNSPSNPSGSVFSRQEIESFLKVLEPHPIWLLSDDTYYTLTYGSEPWISSLKISPSFRSRSCVIGSTSKTYAMTGWRLGWAAGPQALIEAMTKLQSQVTSNPCSLSQAAAEAALTIHHDRIASDLRQRFLKRRAVMVEALQEISGLEWIPPEGAFYLFIKVGPHLPKGMSGVAFAKDLLEIHGVCGIPGEPFGEPDYLRLSYALGEEQIREGILRLKKALKG